jgi:hypothetical protein
MVTPVMSKSPTPAEDILVRQISQHILVDCAKPKKNFAKPKTFGKISELAEFGNFHVGIRNEDAGAYG